MTELTRLAIAVDADNMALGHEVIAADDAEFVRNPAHARVYDANHVRRIRTTTDDAFQELYARASALFGGVPPAQWLCDPDTPPIVAARLTLAGYAARDALIMLLEGPLDGAPPPVTIQPAATAADWDAYTRLKQAEWDETSARDGFIDPAVGLSLAQSYRAKAPPLRYWLAVVDAEPVGFLSSWEGPAGVGQVEDLYVRPDHRRRGIATALVHHGVADCRHHGAGPVVIVAAGDDTPKLMYAALGFQPVAITRKFIRV